MRIDRFSNNPIVSPADVVPSRDDFEVLGTFNAGITEYQGQTLMLIRVAERPASPDPEICPVPVLVRAGTGWRIDVQNYRRDDPQINFSDPRVVSFPTHILLTSISHLRLARSNDGRNFQVDTTPTLMPADESEAFGVEDPRITKIGDTYFIVYKAVSSNGICQSLVTTRDFQTFDRRGIVLCPENMDSMLFPELIDGKYAMLHRPVGAMIGGPMMWIAYGNDPAHFGEHHFLIGKSAGGWDSGRVGGGAPPFRTQKGWLQIYHAATPDDHYCLGGMLLDADKPHIMLAKSQQPIMMPEAPYEVKGFKNNVVFTCGVTVDGDNVRVYYGAADETMCAADLSISEILESLDAV